MQSTSNLSLAHPDGVGWLQVPIGHPFPLSNLPYGSFLLAKDLQPIGPTRRLGVAVGNWVLDLYVLVEQGCLKVQAAIGASLQQV